MPIYVLMTKLGASVLEDPRTRRAVAREWKDHVDKLCPDIKWISHYALLGRYDFMDIYEAPNDEVAHKLSIFTRHSGAIEAESWSALSFDRYMALVDEVEKEVRD